MPLQNLPPEILINIFGWSDSFHTAAALSATNRRFYFIWTENIKAILENIACVILPHVQEANLLADRYEELFDIQSIGDRLYAIRRAMLLVNELRIIQRPVLHTTRVRDICRLRSCRKYVPHIPALEQPGTYLKLSYRVINFMVSHATYEYSSSLISLPRRVFQGLQLRDLRLLPYALYFLWKFFNCDQRLYPRHLRDVEKHFGTTWPNRPNGYSGQFSQLEKFLVSLYVYLTTGEPPPMGVFKNVCLAQYIDEKVQIPEEQELECLLASAPFCTIEGNCWIVDLIGCGI